MNEDRLLYLIALPIILVAVMAEFFYRKNKVQNSLLNLSSNLFCGLIDRLFFLFFGVVQYELLVWISKFSIFSPIKNKILYILLLFLLVDFVWYTYHRVAHTIKLFWTFHITHHQTDDYNFSLGLRVSFLQQLVRTFFWLPIALLGFEPISILIAIFFQSFYQFFLHTDLFDFPRFTRSLFVTPKSHKLHHSNQTRHTNKNFGGVFIIWDKLFGSYQSPYSEKEVSLKAIEDPKIFSPVNAYFSPFIQFIAGHKNDNSSQPEVSTKSSGFLPLLIFTIILIPSVVLILLSNRLAFSTILISAIALIVIAFISSHFALKKSSKMK